MTTTVPAAGDEPADPARLVVRLRAAGCVFAEEEAALLHAEALERHPASPTTATGIWTRTGTGTGHPGGGAGPRAASLEAMTSARVAGEPLETILGWVLFAGRRILLDRGVFVPRRRTERLAHAAASAAQQTAQPVVVDLCCGSGAIAAVLVDEVPGAVVHAADADPLAVACARRNLQPRGVPVHRGDLLEALPDDLRGRIDVLVANVPYVPTAGLDLMPPEARLHEPRATRDGGGDGLDVLRRVVRGSIAWLAPDGVVLLEVAEEQLGGAGEAIAAAGLVAGVEPAVGAGQHEDDGTRVVTGRLRPR